MQEDERQIRALVADWMAASKAGEVEKVLAMMTEDVVFLGPGRAPMCKADFAVASQAQLGSGAPTIDGVNDIEELKILGDWAFSRGKLTIVITPPNGGPSMRRVGHVLTIFQKVEGRWLLARDANMTVLVQG